MFFRIWAVITGQYVVHLIDEDSEITTTVAKKTQFGLVAKRYWPFNIRNVILNDDGTVENGFDVKEWRKG